MAGVITLSRQLPKPLMVYDGECGFCMKWIRRWERTTGEAVEYDSLQATSPHYPEIPRASFEHEVKLITTDGRVYGGAEAVFRSLNLGAHPGIVARLAWSMYRRVPGFAAATEFGYRLVAQHRSFFSAITRWM